MNVPDAIGRSAGAARWLGDASAARADLELIAGAAVHGPVIDADVLGASAIVGSDGLTGVEAVSRRASPS